MGGWLAIGVARHHPERLSSLVVGGWDPINGLPPGPAGPLTFDLLFRFCKRTTPALVEWITPEIEPGVRACFAALAQLEGAREAVLGADFPVLIWKVGMIPITTPGTTSQRPTNSTSCQPPAIISE